MDKLKKVLSGEADNNSEDNSILSPVCEPCNNLTLLLNFHVISVSGSLFKITFYTLP